MVSVPRTKIFRLHRATNSKVDKTQNIQNIMSVFSNFLLYKMGVGAFGSVSEVVFLKKPAKIGPPKQPLREKIGRRQTPAQIARIQPIPSPTWPFRSLVHGKNRFSTGGLVSLDLALLTGV